jgi:hypothetical protein
MTAINSNRAIRGPVTAVPVVAGKGVRLTADTENNRWIVEADETVLFTSDSGVTNNITLSEAIENFDSVKIEWCPYTESSNWTAPYDVVETKVSNGLLHLVGCGMSNDTNYQVQTNLLLSCSTTSITVSKVSAILTTTSASSIQSLTGYKIFKIVGINRIASN